MELLYPPTWTCFRRIFLEGYLEIELLLDQLSVIRLCVVSFKHFLCQKRLLSGWLNHWVEPIRLLSCLQ